jgi:hypothetical protein
MEETTVEVRYDPNTSRMILTASAVVWRSCNTTDGVMLLGIATARQLRDDLDEMLEYHDSLDEVIAVAPLPYSQFVQNVETLRKQG